MKNLIVMTVVVLEISAVFSQGSNRHGPFGTFNIKSSQEPNRDDSVGTSKIVLKFRDRQNQIVIVNRGRKPPPQIQIVIVNRDGF